MSRAIATRNGREVKAYYLDGDGMKAIPMDALTTYDLDKWFAGTAGKAKDAVQYMQRVGVLFRCVELRMQALGGMPRQIEAIETGEILSTANFSATQFDEGGRPLIEDILPFIIDLDDLLLRTEMAQCLRAETYWHILKNRVTVTEVRWLDPRTITPKYTEFGVRFFQRRINGRLKPDIPVEDMAYIWRPGLQEQGPGIAPGQVAARQAGISDNMDTFIETFFEKGAMPTTIVFAETKPPEQERGRIKAYLERILTGIGNAFGVEVLNAALRFEKLTPPLKEMLLPDIKDKAQREIAVSLGIPLSLIFSEASNFATAQVDDLNFYTKTMVPEALFIASQLNRTFFKLLGMRLVPRPDQLEIFQQREIKKSAQAIWLFDRGAIDKDELRQSAGYQPLQGTPAEPATASPQQTTLSASPPAPSTAKGPRQELKQWERKVLKRFPKVRPYTIPFEPHFLKAEETAVIRGRLLTAQTTEEVKAAFVAPFRGNRPNPAKAADATRSDNEDLDKLEGTAISDVEKALREQLDALRTAAPGGKTEATIIAGITAVLAANSETLLSVLTNYLLAAAALGMAAAEERLLLETAVNFSWDLADAAAAEFVEGYAFDLVTGINNTTADRLRGVLRQWINDGGTLDELADGIRPIFADEPATRVIEAIFNVDRATMIAETEATRAYVEGKIISYTSSGLADSPPDKKPPDDSHVRCRCDLALEKQDDGSWHWIWLTVNDERVCPICAPLDGQSVGIAKEAPDAN